MKIKNFTSFPENTKEYKEELKCIIVLYQVGKKIGFGRSIQILDEMFDLLFFKKNNQQRDK